MKKYNKTYNKKKNGIKFVITLMIIIILILSSILAYIIVNNNIVHMETSDRAKFVLDDEAKNSTPIIINNLLLGGVYNSKFVSVDKYYLNSKNKKDAEIELYSLDGKLGEYKVNSIEKNNKSSIVYAKTDKENIIKEYYAVGKGTNNALCDLTEIKESKEDSVVVKNALGIYKFLNSSVNITKVYEVKIEPNTQSKIIVATSKKGEGIGAYSAVIVCDKDNKNPVCVKYNYVRDLKNAKDYGLISVKFVCDLNGDGVREIVLQDTKEFETEYLVMEKQNNKFVNILSTKIE